MPDPHYLGIAYRLRAVGGYDIEAVTVAGGRILAREQSEQAARATLRRRLDAETARGVHIASSMRARLAHGAPGVRDEATAAVARLDEEIGEALGATPIRTAHVSRLRELRAACYEVAQAAPALDAVAP